MRDDRCVKNNQDAMHVIIILSPKILYPSEVPGAQSQLYAGFFFTHSSK
jgi:hypothetical protein